MSQRYNTFEEQFAQLSKIINGTSYGLYVYNYETNEKLELRCYDCGTTIEFWDIDPVPWDKFEHEKDCTTVTLRWLIRLMERNNK